MFLSGELHGDERVGPTAVIEYAIFLLQNRAYYDSTYRTITQFSSSEGKASLPGSVFILPNPPFTPTTLRSLIRATFSSCP